MECEKDKIRIEIDYLKNDDLFVVIIIFNIFQDMSSIINLTMR